MIFDRNTYINTPLIIENELQVLFNINDALTIFEIGACEGEDSIKYSRLFKNSKIHCFEPLPQNIEYIKENIDKYKCKNISVHSTALSDKDGFAEFYVSGTDPENAAVTDWDYGNKSSSLLAPDKHLETAKFITFGEFVKGITYSAYEIVTESVAQEDDPRSVGGVLPGRSESVCKGLTITVALDRPLRTGAGHAGLIHTSMFAWSVWLGPLHH